MDIPMTRPLATFSEQLHRLGERGVSVKTRTPQMRGKNVGRNPYIWAGFEQQPLSRLQTGNQYINEEAENQTDWPTTAQLVCWRRLGGKQPNPVQQLSTVIAHLDSF